MSAFSRILHALSGIALLVFAAAGVAQDFPGRPVRLIENVDQAPVDEKMKPILRYVRKLTLSPSKMTLTDANAVFAAGWDEQALHDAVSTCALFNFMNRFVDGHGIKGSPEYFAVSAKRLHDGGYSGLLRMLDQ